jgi:hypothetical protein
VKVKGELALFTDTAEPERLCREMLRRRLSSPEEGGERSTALPLPAEGEEEAEKRRVLKLAASCTGDCPH